MKEPYLNRPHHSRIVSIHRADDRAWQIMLGLAAVFMLFLFSSCSGLRCCASIPVKETDDNVHIVVIGFGWITVPKHDKDAAVTAIRSHALGVSISDQPGFKLGVGYSSSSVVEVPDGAEDVRVEVSQKPWGPLIIDTPKAAQSSKDK